MADVEIHWLVNSSAACFHSAETLLRGETLENVALTQAFEPLVDRLSKFLADNRIAYATFLSHLVPLAAQLDSNRPLATALLGKTVGPHKGETVLTSLVNLLSDFERTFQQQVPTPAEQIAEHAANLRQQFAAFGQTLLAGVGQVIEPEAIVESARVLLVPPNSGGGGRAYFLYNMAGIEVVSGNPIPELPEVVRLCWLIAQLNADLPMYQGEIHRDRLVEIVPLAMIPAALTAATELGLAKCDAATIGVAIEKWGAEPRDAGATASTLWNWWDAYINRKPRWPVALAALDQLLRSEPR